MGWCALMFMSLPWTSVLTLFCHCRCSSLSFVEYNRIACFLFQFDFWFFVFFWFPWTNIMFWIHILSLLLLLLTTPSCPLLLFLVFVFFTQCFSSLHFHRSLLHGMACVAWPSLLFLSLHSLVSGAVLRPPLPFFDFKNSCVISQYSPRNTCFALLLLVLIWFFIVAIELLR